MLFYKKEINLNLYKIKTFEDIKFYMEYYNINMLKQILYALEYDLKTLKKISIFKKKKPVDFFFIFLFQHQLKTNLNIYIFQIPKFF